MKDYIVRATTKDYSIRIFSAVTTKLVEEGRKNHNTTPVATATLGRLLTAGAMMGSMLKGDNELLTLQMKGNGPLRGIVVTADSKANVKGYVDNPLVDIPLKDNGKLDVSGAIGQGDLTVIKDMGLKDPYIGKTKLVTGEVAEDITYYYANSEQVPSAVGLGVLIDRDYTVKCSGGFIVQLMPEATEEAISKLEGNLKKISSVTSLLEEGKTPEDIINILLEGLEVNILDKVDTSFKCNCSKERVEKVLISLGVEGLTELIDEDKDVELNCHFCNTNYNFTVPEVKELVEQLTTDH